MKCSQVLSGGWFLGVRSQIRSQPSSEMWSRIEDPEGWSTLQVGRESPCRCRALSARAGMTTWVVDQLGRFVPPISGLGYRLEEQFAVEGLLGVEPDAAPAQ